MAKFRFFEIEIPEINQITRLGGKSETALVGKISKFPLADAVRGKSGEIKYVIEKRKDGKDALVGKIKGVRLFLSYISRFARRGVTNINESCKIVVDSGKSNVQIKTIIMARKKVGGAVKRHIRNEGYAFLQKTLQDARPEEVFSMILRNELQQKLGQRLKKIYPLAYCEIREANLLGK
jgi:ribosomal protein S3AE